jgi:hypothetical protein
MKFENQTFVDQDITLDYNEFVDCQFRDCRIHYHGSPWSVVRIKFDGRVMFFVGGAAKDTVAYLQFIRSVVPESFEQLINQTQQATPPPGSKPN